MTPGDPDQSDAPAEPAWVRRRRLAAVFGEVLPDTTDDERDPEAPAGERSSGEQEPPGDAWLREQVPPHHG